MARVQPRTSRPSGRTALYARVSTADQHGEAQIARLRAFCAQQRMGRGLLVFVDEASGKCMRRPAMERLLSEARGHHVQRVLVVKVDRWARSVKDLVSSLEELRALGVEWHAIEQGIRILPDRNDATTNLILQVLGAVAEWEGSIISERTKQGLAFARASGKRLGRPVGSKDRQPRSNKGYLARYAGGSALQRGAPPQAN